jgi:DNA-binding CsgD family transcriptional regulator
MTFRQSDAPSRVIQHEGGTSLARRRLAFVGRESEMGQLESAFETAAAGHGALIMLAGEPGIGKTALCEQVAGFVAARGGVSLVGHCYPEVSAGVPYQPFVEAFEGYARERDAESLRAELGSSAREVARMVPALRSLLPAELTVREDPEDERLRLLSGVMEILRGLGASRPLLLVLEDLHDADRGTLDLLVYLARHLPGVRLLVVGTYRDVEVDRAHPLSEALAELRRVSQVERMQLGELSVDEVQRLLAGSSRQTVARPLAELVHRRAGGNALFTHELLRFLLAEGLVERRDGMLRRVGEASIAGRMPEGLRDVVGKRLSRLSPETNQVLSVASVIGRDFQLEVLRRAHPRPEHELESALEEASAAAIVEERSAVGATITYRFAHAFFQQTLYDEIVAPRRIRLHQHVARVLEEIHARRLDEHAAELAEHYAFSSDTSDLARAVRYGELAARRAVEVFAFGEAAHQLERALVVQDLVDPDDRARRSDLLLALGEVLLPAGETERVIAHIAPDALALAEELGDRGRAFRACRLALDGLFAHGYRSAATLPEYLAWAERAGSCADPDSIERVHADLALGQAWHQRRRLPEARALQMDALALARRLDDPETLFRSADVLLHDNEAPQHWADAVRLAEEAAGWPRQGVSGRTLGWVLWMAGRLRLAEGERARAEDLWRQLEELADRTHVVTARLCVLQRDAVLAIIDGHLEDALTLLREYVEHAVESGQSVRGRDITLLWLVAPAIYLGRAETWLATFDEYTRLVPQVSQAWSAFVPTRAVCLAHLGRVEEASAVVVPLLDEIEPTTSDDGRPTAVLVMLLQAAVLLGHRAAAVGLSARLERVAHVAAYPGTGSSCIARHLADAAALVGDRAAARAYCLQALEAAGKIRFRPELALTHLRLAELLLQDEDDEGRSEALEHLEIAIPELRDMHMRPWLERALALRDDHQPSQVPAPVRPATSDTLTAREREIASLVADGLSNRDIAESLVITEGTVEVHVKHILSKLGFRSRTQVAAWVADQHSDKPVDGRP